MLIIKILKTDDNLEEHMIAGLEVFTDPATGQVTIAETGEVLLEDCLDSADGISISIEAVSDFMNRQFGLDTSPAAQPDLDVAVTSLYPGGGNALDSIEWREVVSTNIIRTGHYAGNMFVEFNGGTMYMYLDVPTLTYQKFEAAPSAGAFLAKSIKPYYSFVRLP